MNRSSSERWTWTKHLRELDSKCVEVREDALAKMALCLQAKIEAGERRNKFEEWRHEARRCAKDSTLFGKLFLGVRMCQNGIQTGIQYWVLVSYFTCFNCSSYREIVLIPINYRTLFGLDPPKQNLHQIQLITAQLIRLLLTQQMKPSMLQRVVFESSMRCGFLFDH
jgi:hypothetical protein